MLTLIFFAVFLMNFNINSANEEITRNADFEIRDSAVKLTISNALKYMENILTSMKKDFDKQLNAIEHGNNDINLPSLLCDKSDTITEEKAKVREDLGRCFLGIYMKFYIGMDVYYEDDRRVRKIIEGAKQNCSRYIGDPMTWKFCAQSKMKFIDENIDGVRATINSYYSKFLEEQHAAIRKCWTPVVSAYRQIFSRLYSRCTGQVQKIIN